MVHPSCWELHPLWHGSPVIVTRPVWRRHVPVVVVVWLPIVVVVASTATGSSSVSSVVVLVV